MNRSNKIVQIVQIEKDKVSDVDTLCTSANES